jgi:hypothetical protein
MVNNIIITGFCGKVFITDTRKNAAAGSKSPGGMHDACGREFRSNSLAPLAARPLSKTVLGLTDRPAIG